MQKPCRDTVRIPDDRDQNMLRSGVLLPELRGGRKRAVEDFLCPRRQLNIVNERYAALRRDQFVDQAQELFIFDTRVREDD